MVEEQRIVQNSESHSPEIYLSKLGGEQGKNGFEMIQGLRKDENMFHLAKFGKHQSPINTETQEQAEPKTGMKV